jgi:hypothetical protein
MATRRSRFLDSVVLAAALAAAGAGMTAAVGLWIDGDRSRTEIAAATFRERCSEASEYLRDESVNRDLTQQQKTFLASKSYDAYIMCSKDIRQ